MKVIVPGGVLRDDSYSSDRRDLFRVEVACPCTATIIAGRNDVSHTHRGIFKARDLYSVRCPNCGAWNEMADDSLPPDVKAHAQEISRPGAW